MIVIFTDLDGTLLDDSSYSFEPAHEALAEVRIRKIPLILCTSKTRAEKEAWRWHCHVGRAARRPHQQATAPVVELQWKNIAGFKKISIAGA
jgi:predicted mannosyl-3-phosphoglycerate phosphatase (HAD superfamily)